MTGALQDLRLALRLLARHRGFTATAVLTLATCIGANAAIFAIVHGVLLKPLPVPEPERLVLLYNAYPNAGARRVDNAVPDYFDRLAETTVFEELTIFRTGGVTVGADQPERVTSQVVTPSFFRLLGTTAFRGRLFSEEDAVPGRDAVAVISHAVWQERLGGRDLTADTHLRIDDHPCKVIGVLPAAFRFGDPDVRIWLPKTFTPEERGVGARHSNNWAMVGRLKPGATMAETQAQIDALNRANDERFPQFREILRNAGFHTRVVSLQDDMVRGVRPVLYLLWGGVLFVLLIGCVNLTNLLLVRASSRAREIATRTALGAGAWRIARQLLAEAVLLTAAGAVLALALARMLLTLLTQGALETLPRADQVSLDPTVVAYSVGLAALVGFVVSLVPLLHVLRVNLTSIFRDESRGATASRSTRLLRRALVTAQVAVAFVLLAGAGLLLESFRQVLRVDPGFVADGVLTGRVSAPQNRYLGDAALRSLTARVEEQIGSLPGVVAVGVTSTLPMAGDSSDSVTIPEGYRMAPGESVISPNLVSVTPGYFEAMRIPLRRGRLFDARDTDSSAPAVIVDERLARRFWPDRDPVGQRMWRPSSAEDLVTPGPDVQRFTVVGVVGDVKVDGLVEVREDQVGAYYQPYSQAPERYLGLAVRTEREPDAIVSAVRAVLAAIDPQLPLYDVQPMTDRLNDSLTDRRTPMMLAVLFAGIALFLAAVGIYGVLAYQVWLRTKEIGIRLALGSDRRRIVGLVVGEGAVLVALGVATGLGGALALRRTLEAQLYDVSPTDPFVLALVVGVLSLVTLVACALPARRAAAVDPLSALNES